MVLFLNYNKKIDLIYVKILSIIYSQFKLKFTYNDYIK